MRKLRRILSAAAIFCLILSLSSFALAADSDWADYQKYVISFAEAGAPTAADAEEFTNTILGCSDMDSLLAGTGMGVIFEVMGAMPYDDWIAAGKPAADTSAISGESAGASSGDKAEGTPSASGDKTGGVPSGEAAKDAGVPASGGTLTVHAENGQKYILASDLLALLGLAA